MLTKYNKLLAYLKYLDIKPDVDNSISMFMIQNVGFLLKSMNLNVDYNFKLWMHGPYSTVLEHDYYNNMEDFNNLNTNYELIDKEKEKLDLFSETVDKDKNIIENTSMIIIMGLQYKYEEAVIEKISKIKAHLTKADILSGINKARKLLFKDEYLTQGLMAEIKAWDEIV